MSPWIALAIGIFIGWALMMRKCTRLETFVSDPSVHAELMKFMRTHAERDRAQKIIDAHRNLERSVFGDLDPHSDEAIGNVPSLARERWCTSIDGAALEEQHVIAAYQAWHEYNARMEALIARHQVSRALKLRMVQSYDPQVFPHG